MLRTVCFSAAGGLRSKSSPFYSWSRNLNVGILGAPFNKGQRLPGVEDGPKVIRDTGLIKDLQAKDVDVRDYGDVLDKGGESASKSAIKDVGPYGEFQHQSVLCYNRLLSSRVSEVLRDGRVCVTLGGDHTMAIGTIHGHANADPSQQVVVLWVDAHSDINTGATSPSGNMHGMALAYQLTHLAHSISTLPDGFPQPALSSSQVAFIGLRDVDPGERDILNQLGILNFGMREVDHLGVEEVVARCLAHLDPGKSRPLHMSFDIDVLDPAEAPSTGTPVRGGLSLREGMVVAEAVRKCGHLRAMDMVEVNPELGNQNDVAKTALSAKLVTLAALVGRNS